MTDITRLGDQREIDRLLARYCRAVDSKDWAGYRAMFTDDARVDYSAAGLVVGTVDDAVRYLNRHQGSITVGVHHVTNIETRVDGDRAEVVAMWFNIVRLPGAEDLRFLSGRWHDSLIRAETGWRIRDLRLEVAA